jgi:hypothetical protein
VGSEVEGGERRRGRTLAGFCVPLSGGALVLSDVELLFALCKHFGWMKSFVGWHIFLLFFSLVFKRLKTRSYKK